MASSVLALPLSRGETLTSYDGVFKVKGRVYQFHLIAPNEGNLLPSKLQMDVELQQKLVPYKDKITQLLLQNTDVDTFLEELSKLIADIESVSLPDDLSTLNTDTVVDLLQQLDHIGWDELVTFDATFRDLTLQLQDTHGRPHQLHLHISSQGASKIASCTTLLPVSSNFHIGREVQLEVLLQQFQAHIAQCEDFWTVMSELDAKTWVLEPENPAPNTTHRRIAIAPNASIQIKVDPLHPRMLPEIRFLGADQVVNPLKELLNKNVNEWDNHLSVLDNLQNVLDMCFPSQDDTDCQQLSTECGICYSYRLEDTTPDRVCEDPRCGHAFHQQCLYEWLRGLPTSRQSFNMIFGECPFCSKPITVKMSV